MSDIFDTVVASVELRAADPDRLREFYGATAGSRAKDHLRFSQAPVAEPPPPGSTGLFHTAFRYPDRASLAAAVRRTLDAAPEYQGASDHGVSEAVYFADPEGNGIELYRDRPFDEWPMADGGQLAMGTWPLDLDSLLSDADGSPDDAFDVGHIHLKVADIERTVAFYRDVVGLDERQRFGPQAAFLAAGPYHHHIGANTWQSAGGAPAPADRPGLASYELRIEGAAEAEHTDPDGIRLIVRPR